MSRGYLSATNNSCHAIKNNTWSWVRLRARLPCR